MSTRTDEERVNARSASAYRIVIIGVGFAALCTALFYLPYRQLDLNFAVLTICGLAIGSRILIKIPWINSHVAVSDTFIFLTLLLYGGEAAIVVAALEAYFSALKFSNKQITLLLNAATMAIATSAVVLVLAVFQLEPWSQVYSQPFDYSAFITALALVTLTQFVVNTLIAAGYDKVKRGENFWETWTNKYIWTFFTYLIGSVSAGVLAFYVGRAGFGVALITLPIVVFAFLAYRMYMKNVEMSIEQAEQAERYASDLKQRSIALRESEERFRSAFNHAPIGIALLASDGRCLRVNRALSSILGYTSTELLNRDLQSLVYPDDLRAALKEVRKITGRRKQSCQTEQRFVHKSGRIVWASWSLSTGGDSLTSANLIFQLQDITARKEAEERLQHEATHDALTGLPNRMYFMQRLSAALEKKARQPKYHVSVLFIDLDRFKYVNDSLGHLAGDQLLIAISERLCESMRPPDIVARLGGDEFVILVEGRYFNEKVTNIAARIQRQFAKPFDLAGREVYSSASIGILHASEKHKTSEDIMRDADTAMYHAKHKGKARHEVFDETMRTAINETLKLETDLRRAIECDEMAVEYQPIFCLKTGTIAGVEALARWNHPEIGEISPDRFISLAQEIGRIDVLSDQILRKAMKGMARILKEVKFAGDFRMSVNLSSCQFADPSLVTHIGKILEQTGFSPHNLKLEITESVIFEYQEKAIEMLHELRALGVGIDIDDFGTGYSNLNHLARMPISTLKIDRSFIDPLTEDEASAEIVRTIISMARNLELGVIAEGIETNGQLATLIELGCGYGQGYLLSHPLSTNGLKNLMSERVKYVLPHAPFTEAPELSTIQ